MDALKGITCICLLAVFIAETDAVRCYICLKTTNPNNCTKIQQCPADTMQCHGRKYLLGSEFYHDLDCKSKNLCAALEATEAPTGMGEAADGVDIWSSCCHGSYCNKNFDDQGNEQAPPHMTCYNCTGVKDPVNCLRSAPCADNEVCSTRQRLDEDGKEFFDLGCVQRDTCLLLGNNLPFGRKRKVMCGGCCDSRDNCNNQFCSRKLGLTNMTALGSTVVPGTTTTGLPTTASIYDAYNLTVSPTMFVGTEGSTATFTCKLWPKDASLGTLTLVWIFTNGEGEIFRQDVTDPELSLTIHTLVQEDVGLYRCELNNTVYTWSAEAYLSIGTVNPTSADEPDTTDHQTVESGKMLMLSCQLGNAGQPITWQKMEGTRVVKTLSPTGDQLILGPVVASDAGIYRCFPSDNPASTSHVFKVSVHK